MVGVRFKLIFLLKILTLLAGSHSLQWSEDFPDHTVIQTVVGSSLTLPWSVTPFAGETLVNVTWIFVGNTSSLIAKTSNGAFMPMPLYSDRVRLRQNVGLVISPMTLEDSGAYTVDIVLRDDTGSLTGHEIRSAIVQVYPAEDAYLLGIPLNATTSDGLLHIKQHSTAVYDDNTDQWAVMLTCGHFTSLGNPLVSVQWQTPSGNTLNSTFYSNGSFALLLTTPVPSGNYTCRVVSSDSQVEDSQLGEATLSLDQTEARMTLFEAKLESVYRQNQALVVENAKLAKQLEDVATASFVTFHANLWRDVHLQHGDSLLFIAGLDNSHGAYDSALGQFTAPINGTYFFIVSCAAQKGAGHEAGIMLTADDDIICYEDGSHEGVMSVCHVAVHLLEGQRVVAKSNGEGYFKGLGSAFTGFLISADPV